MKGQPMLSIYDFQEPESYLKAIWDDKQQKNNRFSLRSWAKQIGLKHHNTLHYMVTGKRKISKSQIPMLIQALELNETEGKYFSLMVDNSRAKTNNEKEFYLVKMKTIAPTSSENLISTIELSLNISADRLEEAKAALQDFMEKFGTSTQSVEDIYKLNLLLRSESQDVTKVAGDFH